MRDSLLGAPTVMDGPLWGRDVRLARVLAATIPSGDATVVRLRLELMELVNITENFPELPANWATQVVDGSSLERPWPAQFIYIGSGNSLNGLNPSPWGSPFADANRFIAYAGDRADVMTWLCPLVGKSLVYDYGNKQHASILGSIIDELFSPPRDLVQAPQPQPAFALREAGTGVIPHGTGLADSNNGGMNSVGWSPMTAPRWPDEWTSMVQCIRDAPRGLAWEIFGSALAVELSVRDEAAWAKKVKCHDVNY
jgi:hypothetical protein